jgi:hypothetical protein
VQILGSGMSNKMWESVVEHAKTCVLSGKHYVYYASDTRNVGAIFNNIYEFTGLIADDQFISAENLTDNQKVCGHFCIYSQMEFFKLITIAMLHSFASLVLWSVLASSLEDVSVKIINVLV